MHYLEQDFTIRFHYKVFFGSGLFAPGNSLVLDFFKGQASGVLPGDTAVFRKLLIIADSGVLSAHPGLRGEISAYFSTYAGIFLVPELISIPGGEQSKNDPFVLGQVLSAINEHKIDRHSYVAAIGGGAVLDLVGYAAAIAHRGIKLLRFPTTVLSQNDSGVGVKNGVNYFQKKNFLGTFSPPVAVFNDDRFLTTLDDRNWRSGISEAVKVALIKDAEFFDWIEFNSGSLVARDPAIMNELILRCARLHLAHIAGDDPFESGSSRPLDFGHWAAHKMEQLTGFSLLHGEAVAIGIALDVIYSELTGLLEASKVRRIFTLLRILGFELDHKVLEARNEILAGLDEFKEHLGGRLTIMLLSDIGTGVNVHEIESRLMSGAMQQLLLPAQHLTYCTNIHAGETWTDHFAALKASFPGIRQAFRPGEKMGLGLRLSSIASQELLLPGKLGEFRKWLAIQDSYVFTLNGFPYGEFHHASVKDQVHFPDWTTPERMEYTLRLFAILGELLPPGMEGGISTSPLSYRLWFDSSEDRAAARLAATANILAVAARLIRISQETGQVMHLDLEPEPDGLLETGAEFIDWYLHELEPAANIYLLAELGLTYAEVGVLLRRHICLCYDICHFAIGFEDHAAVIEQLGSEGIRIGKLQVSAALKAVLPAEPLLRRPVYDLLEIYNEPVYLHQVVSRSADGVLTRNRDLPSALPAVRSVPDGQPCADRVAARDPEEWRIHFHVPVFCQQLHAGPDLFSTQADISLVLEIQRLKPFTSHLEVETYTWEVLPEELKLPIDQSIIRELNWVDQQLNCK